MAAATDDTTKCEALGCEEMYLHGFFDLQQRDEDVALLLAPHAARPQRKEDEDENKKGSTTTEVQDAGNKPIVAPGAASVSLTMDELAAMRKALRKRKTTSGKDRFIISSAAVRGDRATMEDTSFVSDCKRFAAVFDGHGGAAVAQYLRKNYFALLGPELAKLDEDESLELDARKKRRLHIQSLLKTSMEKIDAEITQKNEWKYIGSTATGVLLYDDVIYSVNVGDCRAVLSRSGDAVELTRDHKPNDPSEQSRIESLGGRVKWHGYVDAQGDPIEPYGAYRINGNLAVARAIGDRDLRPFVTGEPEVKAFPRDMSKDEFIVIASDGLWDVFTSDEVVTFVKDVMSGEVGGRESWRSGGHSDTRVPIFEWSQQYKSDRSMIKAARKRRQMQIATYLVQEALYRGTSDNVSVIVVWLR
uniref:PPM-type phosphatase domain-containing protein n=1 Tax=Globisporangium ultimum (strain ATCC 200006 / CBS 805.95 / DAOM BR144) TaxID=431595 RepID=K3WIB5_GLOUD